MEEDTVNALVNANRLRIPHSTLAYSSIPYFFSLVLSFIERKGALYLCGQYGKLKPSWNITIIYFRE